MKRLLFLAAVFGVAFAAGLVLPAEISLGQDEDPLAGDQCIACHTENDYMPEGFLKDDIHMQRGLSCAGCHGGDPTSDDDTVAMSPDNGFVGVPTKQEIPQFCGKCHSDVSFMRRYQPRIETDQVSRYLTSIHGQRLVKGDRKVADCTSCHTAHGILPAKDARSTVYALNVPETCHKCHSDAQYMGEYGIPTNQYDDFARGVHGKALLEDHDTGAPACNDCHDNHGAVPPGVASVRQVCGHCHVNNMKYFTASKMGEAFEEEQLHGCEECHGNHYIAKTSDEMVGTGDRAVCMDCHSQGEKGYEAAAAIRARLDSLVTVYDAALGKQERVQDIGMDDVEIGYLLQESHQSLIQARTLVHTFDPEAVGAKTREGVAKAEEALVVAAAQIKDHGIRRRGFGMATLFITILIVALFLKIRQLDLR